MPKADPVKLGALPKEVTGLSSPLEPIHTRVSNEIPESNLEYTESERATEPDKIVKTEDIKLDLDTIKPKEEEMKQEEEKEVKSEQSQTKSKKSGKKKKN